MQFCPFKSSGEEAQKKQAPPEHQQTGGRKLMRRATKSFITPQHKGVLTVAIISASNLSVRLGICMALLRFLTLLGSKFGWLWNAHWPGRMLALGCTTSCITSTQCTGDILQ